MSATFSGPLPPPDILIKYNDAVPNGAERIIVMAERQSDHRMKMENRVTDAGIVRANLGLAAGFIVALAFLGVAYLLIDRGHAWAGGTLGAVNIAAIVATFVYGTVTNSRERQRRAQMMTGDS